jgi:hypothetical protein
MPFAKGPSRVIPVEDVSIDNTSCRSRLTISASMSW